jgi:hypothetical protein
MKKRNVGGRNLKQLFLAVPAAALMLGSSLAQTTVGLNFQAWYYGAGTTNQAVVGYGKGYQTTGFPVTATAFGVPVEDWTSTAPLNANSVSVSTNFIFDSITAEVTAPDMWQSGIGELVYGWNPEMVAPGNNEVTWSYLDSNSGQSPSITLSGLAAKFPHGYVVQTIAAENGVTGFDDVFVTDGTTTNDDPYSTYYVASPETDTVDAGGTVGLSAPSGVFTSDTINIECQPQTTGDRSTLAGFIITDQPVVSQDPPDGIFGEGNPFTLSAGILGVTPLAYQWRTNGVPIPGATNATYTNLSSTPTDAGNYDVVVTNLYGTATSGVATVTVLLPYPAQTVTWDADTGTAGPQDGDGTWNFTPAQWWIGSSDETWWTNNTAEFGVGGAGPYTVTLAADMVAAGVIFNGGNYTITNTSGESLTLQGPSTITANAAATISAPLSTGTNSFFKAGTGTLIIESGGLTSGEVFVNDGTLEVMAKDGDSPYVITNGATLEIGYTTGGGYANTGMQLYGDGASAITGLYLAGGTTYNVSGTPTLLGAPTTIRQFGSGLAALGIFDINSVGLWCTSAASGSVIDPNIQLVNDGYGMALQVDAGANTATGDLTINGPLNVNAKNGIYGLYKRGTGSLLLNGVATSANCGLEILAGSVICGVGQCIGANAGLNIAPAATLNMNGTSQTVTNVLTQTGSPGMAGMLIMSINKGGVPNSTVLAEDDGNMMNFGGNLTVTSVGAPLVLGDTFTLFSAGGGFGGGFANITLPTLTDGLGWSTNNLDADGSIEVVKGSVPPSIVDDLSGTTNYAYVGGSTSFGITAAGDATLRYYWVHNGTTPVGSDSPTLSFSNLTTAADGYYYVIVSNDYGSIGSQSNYLTVVPTSGYDALVLAAGPLAFWPLNETSGTTAFDYWSGYDANYLGGYTLDQATNPVTGMAGAHFDGGSGYALTPYYPALNPAVFSAEAWVNPDSAPVTTLCVLCCGEFASPRSGWLVYQNTNGWNFRTFYGVSTDTAVNITSATLPVAGAWTHLAVTWDGTTARLYVNGALDGSQVSTTVPNYLPGTGGGFAVGGRADGSFWWAGTVSDAVLYNHVLTAQEISAHAQNQPLLSIAPVGTNVVLTWTGQSATVQASPTLTGTFTNVPGATNSPWTNTPSGQNMFFRLKF